MKETERVEREGVRGIEREGKEEEKGVRRKSRRERKRKRELKQGGIQGGKGKESE